MTLFRYINIYNIYTNLILSYNFNSKNDNPIFYTKSIPKFTIKDFCNRIEIYCKINASVFIYALILLNRVLEKGFVSINIHTIYILTLILLLISSKMLEDEHYSNNTWARVGGMSVERLNILEKKILKKLDYHVHVNLQEYEKVLDIFKLI